MSENGRDLYVTLRKTILLTAALLVFLWFLFEIREVLLLFLFAASLAVVINSPVTWMERKGLNRIVALFLVFAVILSVIGLFAWFLVPRLIDDFTTLVRNLPTYLDNLRDWLVAFVAQYPTLEAELELETALPDAGLPFVSLVLRPLGRYSLSFLGWLAIIIFLFSLVLYMVAYPIPLLETYQRLFPPRWREPGTRAFVRASTMIVGWIRANLIAGLIEAVAVAIFLSFLNVPAALVWAALAFFAELIPRLGLYLMALPPIFVALSIEPLKALWVFLFFIGLDQTVGHFILPRVQKETMDVHPVLILFTILAMAAAFGLVGALMAVPLAAIFKAYYEAFVLEPQPQDPRLDERVQRMLHVDVSDTERAPGEEAPEIGSND